ncbi:hypothetical protein [Aestuariibacter salexigens]|uniref:hypothetical protein n=1 Tax=Aestuariibacter salexigens TaxID=226010 RepID=UPI00047988D7|nr:hypothetical protein [Aestuariibacter salexigens]
MPKRPFRKRNGWLILLFTLLSLGLYALYWLFRLHEELPRRRGIDHTGIMWITLFAFLTFCMLGLMIASGIRGEWQLWHDASTAQQLLFSSGLTAGVALNVLFGRVSERLTDRVQQLLSPTPPPMLGTTKKALLIFGVCCQMLAMLLPLALEVALISLPQSIAASVDIIARLGGGSLLGWCIVLHQDIRKLAENGIIDLPNS